MVPRTAFELHLGQMVGFVGPRLRGLRGLGLDGHLFGLGGRLWLRLGQVNGLLKVQVRRSRRRRHPWLLRPSRPKPSFLKPAGSWPPGALGKGGKSGPVAGV